MLEDRLWKILFEGVWGIIRYEVSRLVESNAGSRCKPSEDARCLLSRQNLRIQ